MGNPGSQRHHEPLRDGLELLSNPRVFPEYGRQKGWERETKATDISNGAEKIPEGFEEVTEQMELPF